jgi:hypothetical protein
MDCMKHWFSFPRVVVMSVVASAVLALAVGPSGATSNSFNVTKVGASFALPAKWIHVPLKGADINKILNTASKDNPQLKSVLTTEVTQADKKGIIFFAFGSVAHDFLSNVNIIVTSAAGEPSGSSYYGDVVSQLKAQLPTGGFKDVHVSIRQLPMGKEIVVNYHLSEGAGRLPAQGLQIYARHKDKFDIITFTSTSQATDAAAAQVLEDSWKWN